MCVTLVYASTDSREMKEQLDYLLQRKCSWGKKWVIRGDFNDIRDHEEKKGGRRRQDGSSWGFRNFVTDMEIGEVKFRGDIFT